MINHENSKILVKNSSHCLLRISQCYKLDHLIYIIYDNYFLIDSKYQAVYNFIAFLPSLHYFSNLGAGPLLYIPDFVIETVLDNGIKIYKNEITVRSIANLVL